MNILLGLLIAGFAIGQGYYWLIYVPRAWRNGSNREINDIKAYADYLRSRS